MSALGDGTLRCAGCNREIEVGHRYIEDSVSGFMKRDATPEVDGLISELLGGVDGKIVYCEDCTQEGGDYMLMTYHGDEEKA